MDDKTINKWKRRHGGIFAIEVAPEGGAGEPLVFVFRKPDRAVFAASTKVAQSDPLQAADVMIRSCLLTDNAGELDDMSVFQAVADQFQEMNKAREATLKKL